MRSLNHALALMLSVLTISAAPTPAPTVAPLPAPNYEPVPTPRDGQHGFDFEFGTWRTHYRLLKDRLVGSHYWYDCYGTSIITPFWGGSGNIEDGDLRCSNRYIDGVTVRLYSPRTHQWTLWWGTRALGLSPPQQVGHYDAAHVGQFYAHDFWKGTPVICRFKWTIVNGVPHFEQAYSTDGGRSWEPNWTTDYARVAETAKGAWNAIGGPHHADFAFLLGRWTVREEGVRPGDPRGRWYTCSGTADVRPFWGGDAHLEDDELLCGADRVHGVAVRMFNDTVQSWLLYSGDRENGMDLGMPARGNFTAPNTGEFVARNAGGGRTVTIRCRWSIQNGHPHFERALSFDGGGSWQTDFIANYTRS
jgi:hypothetical protein